VDTKQWQPAPWLRDDSITLLAVGRLVRAKRFDRFLDLIAQLRREVKREVRGVIAGAGPLESELKEKAAALGLLPGMLEFAGAVSDLVPLYRRADLLVITSEDEGTPNALLEAMACALPVVATRVGGIPDVVRHRKNGLLVNEGYPEELSAAVKGLITDSDLRQTMGRKGRAYVEAKHSVDSLPSVLKRLYELALTPWMVTETV
jgi:glycosyltransferase involved in cell wall biosynthesis